MTRAIPILFALWLAPALAQARPALYRVDPVHTQVLFTVSHDGFSNPVGRFHVKAGWLRFDPDDWAASKVELDIDTGSVDLGDADWNKAACGPRFLACKRYPTAHFVSTSVRRTGTDSGMMKGTLTLRGTSLPVTVSIRLNRRAFTIFGAHTVAGFSGRATLDRTDFGMTAYTGSVSREIDIRLEFEAVEDHEARSRYLKQESPHAAQE
jgi:polyisoprenoid-binding protein YceI